MVFKSKKCFSYCQDCNKQVLLARQQERTAWLNAEKLRRGCEECGYNAHPAALTWDHIDPQKKSFTIGHSKLKSMKAIEAEIAKCRVLCANCHNIHSHNEKHHAIRR